MRKSLVCLCFALLVGVVGCVTINVYFPAAAAQKAADQFIDSVLDQGSPAAKSQNKNAAPAHNQPDPSDQPRQPPSASILDLLVPAAYAAETPNLRIHTPAVDAIHSRMQQRFRSTLKGLLDSGVIGFTADGLVAVRDASSVALAKRSAVNSAVADENRDRKALYKEIANANGHAEWESKIRDTFARIWIKKAHTGWYYRNSAGVWQKK